jgi:hypothetical protein
VGGQSLSHGDDGSAESLGSLTFPFAVAVVLYDSQSSCPFFRLAHQTVNMLWTLAGWQSTLTSSHTPEWPTMPQFRVTTAGLIVNPHCHELQRRTEKGPGLAVGGPRGR